MRFSVEAWAPEYGVSTDESRLDDSSGAVDVDLEIPAGDWRPVAPAVTEVPECLLFIDGVRRIDAQIWISDGDVVRRGVCATVAAGVVRCDPTSAEVVQCQVGRGLFTGPSDVVTDIDTRHGTYRYVACRDESPEELYFGIHNEMTRLELALGGFDDADLVVFDGPLRERSDPRGVGYVKTQHVQYLPDAQQPVLAGLDAGQRTPLFLISGRGGNKYSWYLRLPGERTQPWAGIVRCEITATGPVAEAAERADQVTVLLPRYASEPHKDGRAPQNLYPIAGLESQLRRRLGDQWLMERALRVAAPR